VIIATIKELERLPNSTSGNPHYRVHFVEGGSAETSPDAAVGYALENSEFRDVMVRFQTVEGLIVRAEPVPHETEASIPVNIQIPAATFEGVGILVGQKVERTVERTAYLRGILAKALGGGHALKWADLHEVQFWHRDEPEPDGKRFTVTLDQIEVAIGYILDDGSGVGEELKKTVRKAETSGKVPTALVCDLIVQVTAFGEVLHP
jgi:hypothetical protein